MPLNRMVYAKTCGDRRHSQILRILVSHFSYVDYLRHNYSKFVYSILDHPKWFTSWNYSYFKKNL